jgi:hypothetical protein
MVKAKGLALYTPGGYAWARHGLATPAASGARPGTTSIRSPPRGTTSIRSPPGYHIHGNPKPCRAYPVLRSYGFCSGLPRPAGHRSALAAVYALAKPGSSPLRSSATTNSGGLGAGNVQSTPYVRPIPVDHLKAETGMVKVGTPSVPLGVHGAAWLLALLGPRGGEHLAKIMPGYPSKKECFWRTGERLCNSWQMQREAGA